MGMENIGKFEGIRSVSVARTGMFIFIEYGYSNCHGELDESYGGESSGSTLACGEEVVG